MASSPNMTVQGMKRWRKSQAFKDYAKYHDRQDWADETALEVWRRALRVIKGEATEEERQKVKDYLSRATEQEAGERKYGAGSNQVSAQTAANRNWGYDRTGRYT